MAGGARPGRGEHPLGADLGDAEAPEGVAEVDLEGAAIEEKELRRAALERLQHGAPERLRQEKAPQRKQQRRPQRSL